MVHKYPNPDLGIFVDDDYLIIRWCLENKKGWSVNFVKSMGCGKDFCLDQ